FYITLVLNESLSVGNRIAIMKDGEVVEVGTGEEILSNPANDYVKRFVEDIDRTKVYTAEHIMEEPAALSGEQDKPANVLRVMNENSMNNILVVDNEERLLGNVTCENVESLYDIAHYNI